MNSIISWVGGKKALRDLIYLRMPKNYDRYIEVFGGGGWVLFGKPPDKCKYKKYFLEMNHFSLLSCKPLLLCQGKTNGTASGIVLPAAQLQR